MMLYQRSLDIEQRLQAALRLIRSGGYSTPTVSRDVTALRERGHDIRSERKGNGWRFVLANHSSKTAPASHFTPVETRQ